MITLASDFGAPYPAAMKGVVRRRSDAELIDASHDLPRGDPHAAAFWLRFVLPEFPPAVHCAVVDPGVGTDRAAIVVLAGEHAVVAPDNGLAVPPARALAAATGADSEELEVFEIAVDDPTSATFHGRDVFAPAAARIREDAWTGTGVDREALAALPSLTPADEYVDRRFPEPTVERDGEAVVAVAGEVLVVDDFGNAITNVPADAVAAVEPGDRVRVNGGDPVPFVETFASVPQGDRLVTVGSHGHVECDVNDGRGTDAFGVDAGDPVRLSFE
ncbi:S-adenosylmethionine hydrolase [Halorubrum alkaliphilum]|uniref:S-adenosylmethionine hydrolase n=1 Tax=Halorubrum alkaliphilum TaxID=261290 RepID=A0A8T4GE61_9EURY|nr:SAM-dependent chlorinase/fluorinase [Halorubrum alkaliphilum]MBP1922748.1 S-adenosylmethionine hydrolase [Halorubrum alkaliphilum]